MYSLSKKRTSGVSSLYAVIDNLLGRRVGAMEQRIGELEAMQFAKMICQRLQ